MTATPIQIGQRWQQRSRFKVKPIVRVRQVHRKDRIAEIVREIDGTVGTLIEPIRFPELRKRYRLIATPAGQPTARPPVSRSTDRRHRRHETRVYDRIQALQLRRDAERRARKHAHGRLAGVALEAA